MALDGNEGLPPSNGAPTVITNGHGKGVAAAHQYPPSTPHLNPHNLLILSHQSRGRGVYASQSMSAGTLLDISPVLVFEPQEWAQHGSKTILDSYTFKWGGMGQMALALGLGSLFNHSPHPSVSFSLDRPTHSIRYTLVRDVVAGEELCISYGPWGRQYESNGSTDSDAAAEETDEEQRCCRDLDDMLRIGQDRADSGAESSEASGSSPRRRNTAPRRRTRTRYTAGSASNASSAATMQASKDQQQEGNAAQQHQQQAIRRPMPRIATPPARASPPLPPTAVSSSSVADHPIWRLTSLPDPATIPLTLIPCWALVIDPHASSQVLPFLRRHSRQLGRGSSLGGEEDPLRHAKTLSRKPEDEGKLRALVCPRAAMPDQEAVMELARGSFASHVDVVPVDVASSVAPLKERAAEWSASWPVAFRSSQVAAPVAAPAPPSLIAAPNGSSTSSGADSPSPAVAPPPPSPQPPSLFVDRRADCAFWSAARTQWVVRKLARCVLTAMSAKEAGEVPVAVHICPSILASPHFTTGGEGGSGNAGSPAPAPLAMSAAATTAAGWDADGLPLEGGEAIEVDAHDSRISQRNPIKHAVGNAVRSVAEIRAERRAAHDERASASGGATGETTTSAAADLASSSSTRPPLPGTLTTTATSSPQSSRPDSPFSTASSITAPPSAPTYQPPLLNGQDYLLTSLTLFTTHEPCIYCSMSLVHSRVRHVVLLTPSPKGSGGCCGSQLPASRRCAEDGGPYALHEQRGLNHRFEVWRWRGGKGLIEEEVKRMSGKSVDVERLLDLGEWGKAIDP